MAFTKNKIRTDAEVDIFLKHADYDRLTQNIADAFEDIAVIQEHVSSLVPGAMSPSLSKDMIRTYFLAMIVEMGELLQTLDWKPWKDKKVNVAETKEEFADVIAFLGVILVYLSKMGVDPRDLAAAYIKKVKKNYARFTDGNGEAGYGRKHEPSVEDQQQG